MATFTAEVFQNEYLPEGATEVNAVVTVTSSGTGGVVASGPASVAEMIIIDSSGSMDMPGTKMVAARRAAQAAIDEIVDGALFAVLAGNTGAQVEYPREPGLVPMDERTRAEAKQWIDTIRPGGATTLGAWLDVARSMFLTSGARQCHAVLLTDGKQEGEPPAALDQALSAADGVFQCDCRGIGEGWVVEQLRRISTALLGTVDIVADPANLAADFGEIMRNSMARGVADVRLRVWAPEGSQVRFVRQVAPQVDDLTGRGIAVSPLIREFPTGAWADESRDYHVAVAVPIAPVGSERLAARVELVVDDQVQAKGLVRAVWSENTDLTTRINPSVAHYTGQAELASAIQDGLAARRDGDERTATLKLGRAAQLAHESGNDATIRLLQKVVDIDDPDAGTVRLKRQVAAADEMALDTRSTKTIRVHKEP